MNSNGIEFLRNYSILSALFFKNYRKVDREDTYARRKDLSFDRKKCISSNQFHRCETLYYFHKILTNSISRECEIHNKYIYSYNFSFLLD